MMTSGPTFTIDGTECAAVWMRDFRFHDWALVRELTGLDKEQFVLAHNDDSTAEPDPLVLWGYAAVSYWRVFPLLDRSRMVLQASDWTEGMVSLHLPADEVGEGDAGPPASPEDESGSSLSSESSSISTESSSSPDVV